MSGHFDVMYSQGTSAFRRPSTVIRSQSIDRVCSRFLPVLWGQAARWVDSTPGANENLSWLAEVIPRPTTAKIEKISEEDKYRPALEMATTKVAGEEKGFVAPVIYFYFSPWGPKSAKVIHSVFILPWSIFLEDYVHHSKVSNSV